MGFEFYIAETAGFCWGVKRAIFGAIGKERKVGEPIFVLGDLVHNRDAVEDLEKQNIHVVKNIEEARGETLLITAHGKSPNEIEAARKVAGTVLDMTCPIVEDLHKAARTLKQENRQIVLIGMRARRHPEVEGVIGLLEGEVHVVENLRDVELLPLKPFTPVGIVAQTTFNESKMHELVKAIANRFPAKFIPTICDDISLKQAEFRRLAPAFDSVIVVGDPKSANATHLAEIAKEELHKPTLFVLNGEELEEKYFVGVKSVFVIASASTPPRSIESVSSWLKQHGGTEIEILTQE